MPFSVLSHMLHVERHRQRITRSVMAAGFAQPALGEIQIEKDDDDPILATNMRSTFLLTRKSKEGVARYGFSPCPAEDEGAVVTELARVLWEMSYAHEWGIRCRGVPQAVEGFRALGLEARTLVVSSQLARGILEQADLPPEGLVGAVDKMQVLVTTLPENTALVALAPANAGMCVRVGDNLGMLVRPLAFRVVRTS